MDKLCFIYINTRSLRSAKEAGGDKKATAMEANLEDKLLDIEDDIIQQEDTDFEDAEDEELEVVLVALHAKFEVEALVDMDSWVLFSTIPAKTCPALAAAQNIPNFISTNHIYAAASYGHVSADEGCFVQYSCKNYLDFTY